MNVSLRVTSDAGPQRVAGEEATRTAGRGGVSGGPVGSRSGSVSAAAAAAPAAGILGGSSVPTAEPEKRGGAGRAQVRPGRVQLFLRSLTRAAAGREQRRPGGSDAGLPSQTCAVKTVELFWLCAPRRGAAGAGTGSSGTRSPIRLGPFPCLLPLSASVQGLKV